MSDRRSLHTIGIAIAIGVLAISCDSSDEVYSPERWALTRSDEFEGDEGTPPDPTLWTYDIGGDGWGNQQLEYNTDRIENVSLDGEGHLRIRAIEEPYEGNEYTSGRITTQGLFEQKYGRFEARMKLPEGAGLWPAFWMLGANIEEAPWPECGEIDIMEYQGQRPARMFGTLHGPGYSGGAAIGYDFELEDGETFADDFHLFAIEWDPGRVTFLVDDEVYNIIRSTDITWRGDWVFTNEFFMILNLAVGGTLGGPVGVDTQFPADMLIDYVRVYERVQ